MKGWEFYRWSGRNIRILIVHSRHFTALSKFISTNQSINKLIVSISSYLQLLCILLHRFVVVALFTSLLSIPTYFSLFLHPSHLSIWFHSVRISVCDCLFRFPLPPSLPPLLCFFTLYCACPIVWVSLFISISISSQPYSTQFIRLPMSLEFNHSRSVCLSIPLQQFPCFMYVMCMYASTSTHTVHPLFPSLSLFFSCNDSFLIGSLSASFPLPPLHSL